jgi:hypothetical protein
MCACKKNEVQPLPFRETPVLHPIVAGVIDEASGIADGFARPNSLWVIQDSQQPTELYLLDHEGKHLKKVFIKNVTNRDWEELAVATGPVGGKNYVYIAETGDNDLKYADYAIYRLEEPSFTTDTVTQVDKISFKYPDGAHDAEAMFVDHGSMDIYIITKRDAKSRVYRLAYPQSTSAMNTALYVGELPFTGVVGASLHGTGQQLLVKTYTNIYYFKNDYSLPVRRLLEQPYISLKYQQEPQGEAICFSNDDKGFFTLSEKGLAASVSLNFYQRN